MQTGIKILSIAAGYLMADSINEQVDKILPKKTDTTVTPNVTGPNQTIGLVGELGLGGLLLLKRLTPGMTGTAIMAVGGVLAGAGLKRALKAAGAIKGYHSVPVLSGGMLGRKRMAGYQSTPVLGKIPPQLSGKPAQLQGYTVGSPGYVPAGSSVGFCDGSGVTNTGSGYMG